MPRSSRALLGDSALPWCALLAALLVGTSFLFQRRLDLSLQDEGFLWYGVLRTAEGQLPLRDFRSYDPGRYFWGAAWSLAFGGGVLALRLATHLFAFGGLTLGLLAASRACARRSLLVPIGVVLLVWMFPPWKLYEPAIAMGAVWIAARLVERPSIARHLAAGVFVGVAAIFGRNHGLYCALAFFGLAAFVALRTEPRALARRALSLAAGVVLGYSPMLALAIIAPGFGASLVDSIRFYAEQKSANLALDVPWPWSVDTSGMGAWERTTTLSVGLGFVALPLFYVLALVAALRTRAVDLERRALFLAATFVGVVYEHHAAVRADLPHLAQAIHPLLLGLFAIPGAFAWKSRDGGVLRIAAGLLIFSCIAIVPRAPLAQKLHPSRPEDELVPYDVAGDPLLLPRVLAGSIDDIRAAVDAHVPPEQALFIAPHRPGLYPLLNKVSPTWDTYMAWPASESSQRRMIAELEPVRWALILGVQVGGRSDMSFRVSNPLVWSYLQERFEPAPAPRLPAGHMLLRRRP